MRNDRKWGKIINTDVSAKITTYGQQKKFCSILKGKVPEKECSHDQLLKKAIIAAWREIDDDKALCRQLMASLPHRLQAVVDKEGRQIQN